MTDEPHSPLTVVTRRPSVRLDEGMLTFLERVTVNRDLARDQHAGYRTMLASAGATLIDLAEDDRFPDSTFVEDVLLALPECLVLCRPGTATRVAEPELIANHLPDDRPTLRIEAPATLDGGDVLRIGHTLFVGLSTRTNAAAVASLEHALRRFGYQVVPIRVSGALHLKTSVTAPREDLIVANPAWVDLAPFGQRHIVAVDPAEPFAGNTLRVGETLFMQTAHAATARRLEQAGLRVSFIDISEFAKLEAGLTCMSVVIPPAR